MIILFVCWMLEDQRRWGVTPPAIPIVKYVFLFLIFLLCLYIHSVATLPYIITEICDEKALSTIFVCVLKDVLFSI